MSSSTLAILAIWLCGITAICRHEPLGRPALGATIALASASLIGFLI